MFTDFNNQEEFFSFLQTEIVSEANSEDEPRMEEEVYVERMLDYLHESNFIENGILIEYQDYKHPMYRQLHGDFSTHLGVVDYCMNSNKKIFK